MAKQKLFIDAMPIAETRVSGIGHVAISLVQYLAGDKDFCEDYEITLLVPLGKRQGIERWRFPSHVKVVTYPLFNRVLNGLNRLNILPPLDLLLGKGVYLFPNYRNWPLAFSKSLTYVHDVAHLKYPGFVQEANLHMLQTYLPKWMKRADRVITVSQSAKQDIVESCKLEPSKVAVVYNGVDLTLFRRQSPEDVESVTIKYGIDRPYFFYLSNLEPRKNLVRLIEAYAGLEKSIIAATSLVIVGNDGWRNEEILAAVQVARDNGVSIVRPQTYVPDEDLPALYSGAIALTHPAIYEGFGISPLQALACGTPVLTSNISSMPEVVGTAARLVDPFDTDAIRAGLAELYAARDDWQAGSAERREQAKKFTWQASIDQLKAVLKSL